MRTGQSSVEAVVGMLLLALLLAAGGSAALASWRAQELVVARAAAESATRRGADPATAGQFAVPSPLRSRVAEEIGRAR